MSPSSSISGAACLIICEISLFITAANREAILLVTYASNLRRSLGGTGSESVNSAGYSEIEQPIRARKKHSPLF